jgi:hypothetical protein
MRLDPDAVANDALQRTELAVGVPSVKRLSSSFGGDPNGKTLENLLLSSTFC